MIEAIIFDWVGTLYQFDGKSLFPYSERVLKELHPKYKLAVISKAAFDNIETRLRQIDKISKYFEVIIVDTDKKREQFIECMEKLNVKPRNTLVVDDRVFRGIKIGNQLGCQTTWIQRGKYAGELPNEKTGEPVYMINSIEDLLTIL
jgi:FMN phosphatase YigB (HAD superfamily)